VEESRLPLPTEAVTRRAAATRRARAHEASVRSRAPRAVDTETPIAGVDTIRIEQPIGNRVDKAPTYRHGAAFSHFVIKRAPRRRRRPRSRGLAARRPRTASWVGG